MVVYRADRDRGLLGTLSTRNSLTAFPEDVETIAGRMLGALHNVGTTIQSSIGGIMGSITGALIGISNLEDMTILGTLGKGSESTGSHSAPYSHASLLQNDGGVFRNDGFRKNFGNEQIGGSLSSRSRIFPAPDAYNIDPIMIGISPGIDRQNTVLDLHGSSLGRTDKSKIAAAIFDDTNQNNPDNLQSSFIEKMLFGPHRHEFDAAATTKATPAATPAAAPAVVDTSWSFTTWIVVIILGGLFILFVRFFNWRRIVCIRKTLLCVGWDKFERLDIVVTIHRCEVATSASKASSQKYCVKITAGGLDFWTKTKNLSELTQAGGFDEHFDIAVPQGYRKVIIEVWVISTGIFNAKHRCAQRIIDISETIIARRSFGCVRDEWFSVVKKSDGAADAESFESGKVQLSIQYKEDIERVSSKQVEIIENFTEHPLTAPMASAISKEMAIHPELASIKIEDLVLIIAKFVNCKIQWVTKWGLPSTKFAGVFQKENAKGKMSWYFAVFHKEKDRTDQNLKDVKAMCSLFTISALVPDPKKENYVCLRYQPSKTSDQVDLYFKIVDHPVFMESMHVMIEIVRKLKIQEMSSDKNGVPKEGAVRGTIPIANSLDSTMKT